MTDASLALQKALRDTLRAAIPETPPRDRVREGAPFPRIEIADGQTLDDGADCIDAVEVYLDVHVWSRQPGMTECRMLAGRVRAAVHGQPLQVEGPWRLVEVRHDASRFLTDQDGVTAHAVVTFRALMDPA